MEDDALMWENKIASSRAKWTAEEDAFQAHRAEEAKWLKQSLALLDRHLADVETESIDLDECMSYEENKKPPSLQVALDNATQIIVDVSNYDEVMTKAKHDKDKHDRLTEEVREKREKIEKLKTRIKLIDELAASEKKLKELTLQEQSSSPRSRWRNKGAQQSPQSVRSVVTSMIKHSP